MPLPFNGLYRFDEFELDPQRRSLTRNGAVIPLSSKTFQVLTYLVANSGRVVTKDELLKAVWPESFVEESNLPGYISSLRKALTDCAGYIATVPGQGYQFTARVRIEEPTNLVTASGASDLEAQPVPQAQMLRETTHVVIRETSSPVLALEAPRPRLRHWLVWSSLAVVLAVAGWFVWAKFHRPPEGPYRQIVLADFDNTTGNPNFDRMLRQSLQIDLAQSPYMDVLGEQATVDTLQLMGRKKDTPVTADIAREICVRNNREVLVTGTLTSLGQRYVLTLEASDCASGKHLTGATAQAENAEKVLEALDSAARQIRQGLNESAQSVTRYAVPLRTATTSSLDALQAYSVALYLGSQGKSPVECLAAYQRAVELDPNFAMAYYGIGVNYTWLGQTAVAAQNFKRAFELSGHISAREQLTIRAAYYALGQHNLIDGIKAYEILASTYPDSTAAVDNAVDGYMELGQWDRALAAGEHGRSQFPGDPGMDENLSTIYRSVNRFEDAKNAALLAAKIGKGNTGLDIQLFMVAAAERDQESLAREYRWFDAHQDGATVWYYPAMRGDALAATGELRSAEALYRTDYQAALRAKLPEAADTVLIRQALAEWKLGMPEAAKSTLRRLQDFGEASPEAAAVYAELGDLAYVERFLAAHAETTPDTLMTYVYLPRLRAAVAMKRGKPLEAIAALEPARPYEMRDYTVPTLAGEAYLQAERPDIAVNEFRKIVANPGIDPVSPMGPLAHLGLARAYALERNADASRKEYETFFRLWKDADADLPVLRQARREYDQLKSGTSRL